MHYTFYLHFIYICGNSVIFFNDLTKVKVNNVTRKDANGEEAECFTMIQTIQV